MLGKLNPNDWSQYWQGSTITTFQGVFQNNYSNEIFDFWQRHIPGNHKHVLDVACGNGALSWIANDLLNKECNNSRITGIDFADIDPFKRLGKKKLYYPNISFIPNTPAENLPFENASVDLVVSQYGIEYSDLDKSIPEVGRILKPAGKLCLIMHTDNSALVNTERRMLLACRSVLTEDKLHEKYLELDQLYRQTTDDKNPEIQKTKIEIHQLTYQIRSKLSPFRLKTDLDNYLHRMEKAFSENTPRRGKKREQAILLARDELSIYVRRLEDLISAARTQDDIKHLTELLRQHNFLITEKEYIYINERELCGLSLVAIKQQSEILTNS